MTSSNSKISYKKIKERLFIPLVIIIFLLIISYGYLVNKAVHNVVQREDLETKINELSSEIGEMEVVYLEKVNEVDLSLAYELGFKEPEEKRFVSRKPLGGSFSLEISE